MRPNIGSRIVLVAVAAALGGCSDNPAGPSSPNVPNVAELLGEMSSSTLSSAAAIAVPLGADLNISVNPGKCQYSSASRFFECPAVTMNGLTFTRSFRLIDDAGNSQSMADTHTVALETKTAVDGTVSTSTVAATLNYTLHGTADQTLSGVQTSTHTLNGTSATSINGTMQIDADVFPIAQTVHETTANLVLPNATAGQRWPQSGTITIETSLGTNASSGGSTTQITFNGTSVVTITSTTTSGVTITCHIDLANPAGGSTCA